MVCSLFSLYLNRVDNSGLRRANSWATSSEFAFQFALKCNVCKLDLRPSPPKKTTMLSVTVSPMAKLTHNLKKVAGIFDVPTVLSAPRKLKNLSSCSKCFHPIFSSQTTKISSGADVWWWSRMMAKGWGTWNELGKLHLLPYVYLLPCLCAFVLFHHGNQMQASPAFHMPDICFSQVLLGRRSPNKAFVCLQVCCFL